MIGSNVFRANVMHLHLFREHRTRHVPLAPAWGLLSRRSPYTRRVLCYDSPMVPGNRVRVVAWLVTDLVVSGCRASVRPVPENPPATGVATVGEDAYGKKTLPPVSVLRLAPGVWLHSSYAQVEGYGAVVSHGLLVRTADTVVMVDTAWTDAQTADVLAWARRHLHRPVGVAVATHAHRDKMGGMRALRLRGVRTYATSLSNRDASARALIPAEHALALTDDIAQLAGGALEVFYPGAGHTRDNVVVYLPDTQILFAGCLVRPGDSDSLGNTADADVEHWDDAVTAVKQRYPKVKTVVPSHGDPGGKALLDHTVALARRVQAESPE